MQCYVLAALTGGGGVGGVLAKGLGGGEGLGAVVGGGGRGCEDR